MNAVRRCAVVGGGMLGMRLALDLARRGLAVTVHERAEALGGLAAPWRIGDVTWDRFYHVVLPSDRWLLALLDDLGLGGELRWTRATSAFFVGNRLSPFTTPLDFARFPAIGWPEKLRLAAALWRVRRMGEAALVALRSVPVERWLREASGDRVFERLWRPLLRAKLGSDYEGVSASFIAATMRRLYGAQRRAGVQGGFGYVRGGYAAIVQRFAPLLESAGVQVRLHSAVDAIEALPSGELALRAGSESQRYDAVALTVPPPVAAKMCPQLADRERRTWESFDYRGIVCVSLLLDRALGSAYLTNLADERLPFTAVVEMTNVVDPGELGGWHLAYLPKYVRAGDPEARQSDEEIGARFLAALRLIYPHFDARSIAALRVARAPYVFAPPTLAAGDPPGFATGIPGLFLTSSAQIVDGTLNVDQTLELAARAAEALDATVRSHAIRGAA